MELPEAQPRSLGASRPGLDKDHHGEPLTFHQLGPRSRNGTDWINDQVSPKSTWEAKEISTPEMSTLDSSADAASSPVAQAVTAFERCSLSSSLTDGRRGPIRRPVSRTQHGRPARWPGRTGLSPAVDRRAGRQRLR